MLGDLSGVSKIFLVTGYTDMRKSIDGLMMIIRDNYGMDPYGNSLYLFCGRRCDRIKALHFDKDGFILLYKRLVICTQTACVNLNRYFVHFIFPVVYDRKLIDFINVFVNTLHKFLLAVYTYSTQKLAGHFAKETFYEVKP